MIFKSLELSNYRNYKSININFCTSTNIFYGNNAQGKTNILEALFMSGTTKSHKACLDKEIIKFGEEECHIKVNIEKNKMPFRIDMHLKKNSPKGIAINGIPIKKASELFGLINIIFFSPEDLDIIKGGPVKRRRFIDLELCQVDKIYVNNLVNYNKCLNQRNKLLRELSFGKNDDGTLDIWNIQLSDFGEKIIARRMKFIKELNSIVKQIHGNITNNKENLIIKYDPSVESLNLYNSLNKNKDNDIKLRTTSKGPHRDDIIFLNGDIDLRKYGSQGQQRTAALSVKLSEIQLVESIIHDTPILLLDDVLSELDSSRQNHLLENIKDIQTFITCTGLDDFIKNRFNVNKIFQVSNGSIK